LLYRDSHQFLQIVFIIWIESAWVVDNCMGNLFGNPIKIVLVAPSSFVGKFMRSAHVLLFKLIRERKHQIVIVRLLHPIGVLSADMSFECSKLFLATLLNRFNLL